jgi:hypothetical protein
VGIELLKKTAGVTVGVTVGVTKGVYKRRKSILKKVNRSKKDGCKKQNKTLCEPLKYYYTSSRTHV